MSIRFGRSGNGYDSSQVMETADDDWRNITDLAARRRIQNRLAQRNYRRKLRNRLEELERQAGGEPTTTASASKPAGAAKRTKTTSASSAPGAYSNVNPSNPSSSNNYGQANAGPSNTYYGSDSLDDDLLDLSPLARGSVSPQSADSTESLPFSRTNSDASTPNNGLNLHSGDFGPLLLDVRGPRRVPSMTATPQQQYTEAQSQSRALALSPSPVPELTQASTMSMAGSPPNAGVVGSWQPNDPSNYSKMLSNLVTLEYPQPGPGYSASPIHNPNPLHLNAPLPRDEFYISVPYTKLVAATMTIGRMLKMNENMVCDDDMVSTLTPEVVPEEAIDLKPTALQSRVPHHPYIDLLPFPGYRDRLLAVAMRGAATGDWELESRLCRAMNESWAVWGECPWMAESWEVGEDFASEFWDFLDAQMLRSTNFWRRQRGLKPLRKPADGSVKEPRWPHGSPAFLPGHLTTEEMIKNIMADMSSAEGAKGNFFGKVLGEVE